MYVGLRRCVDNLRVRHILQPVSDVVFDRTVEQYRLLAYNRDRAAEEVHVQ